MKRIVLSLFALAMIFAGCEKVEDQLDGLQVNSKEKSDLPNEIVETVKKDSVLETPVVQHLPTETYNFQLWRPNVDSGYSFPFFGPIADSTYYRYAQFPYWKNYPVLQSDSIGKKN